MTRKCVERDTAQPGTGGGVRAAPVKGREGGRRGGTGAMGRSFKAYNAGLCLVVSEGPLGLASPIIPHPHTSLFPSSSHLIRNGRRDGVCSARGSGSARPPHWPQ